MSGRRWPWWELAAGLALFVLVAIFFWFGWFEDLENRTIDYRFRWRGQMGSARNPVLVSITDDCLKTLGAWPWSRAETHARLVEILHRHGARVVAFDVTFSEPSPNPRPDDDAVFAAAIASAGNVVLPVVCRQEDVLDADMELQRRKIIDLPLPIFRRYVVGEGYIDMEHVRANVDGVIRELVLARTIDGQTSYVLGLVVAARLLEVPLAVDADGVRVGNLCLPTVRREFPGAAHEPVDTYLLNYLGPGNQFDEIRYSEALSGNFSPELFRGKAVLIGTRASGVHQDVKFNPFGAMAGMEIHANLIHNVVTGQVMQRSRPETVLWQLLALALGVALLLARFEGVVGTLLAVGLLPGYLVLAWWAFAQGHTLVVVPVLVLLALEVVSIRFAQLVVHLKRSRDDLAKRVRELSLLNEVSKSTSYIGDLDRTLTTVLGRALQGLSAERGSLFLLDSQYENLTEQALIVGDEHAVVPDSGLRERFKTGEGIAGEVFATGRPSLIRDTRRDPRFKTFSDRDRLIRSLICVPLVTKAGPIGVMNIVNKRDGDFDQEDLNLTLTMANQAAVLIDNARLFNLATIDGLTGLVVHRHFQAKLEEEFRRSQRYEKPLSVIMTDIDHFKKFNDTWGHQTGDMVLREVARIVRNSTRDTDVAGRYGGEEFGVILPETDVDGARLFAERVRQRVEAGDFPGPGGKILKVTISIGVCSIPYHAVPGTLQMVAVADAGLYQSKHGGRNLVSVVDPVAVPALLGVEGAGAEGGVAIAGEPPGDPASGPKSDPPEAH